MTEINQIYKCSICGNIVEVIYAGGGQLVCCGQPMGLISAKEAGEEESEESKKHVPIVERLDGTIRVKVGKIPHPMTKEHYIEWIEIICDGMTHRKFLKVGDKPEAVFHVETKNYNVRAYCNVHGLWEGK